MNAPTELARMITSLEGKVSADEWQTRVDLAAAYRLVALFKWDDLVFTHITARIPGTEHYLINPYGLMFDEITASSLVKIDIEGKVLQETPFPINPAGFVIHSAVHAGAPRHPVRDAHPHAATAWPCRRRSDGVLPISQQSIFVLARLGYHDYEGVALRDDEKPRLVADLGEQHLPDAAQPRPADGRRDGRRRLPGDVHLRGDVRDPDPRPGRRHARER